MESILDVPTLFRIGLELQPRDLLNLCQTSKEFLILCQDDYFWKLKFEKDFPSEESSQIVVSWRQEYFRAYADLFDSNVKQFFSQFKNITDREKRINSLYEFFDMLSQNK